VTAVVPLRDGMSGKSRLATGLDPAARRRLVVALARHVLEVLASSPRVTRVVVVTADEPFARRVLASAPVLIGGPGPVRQFELPNRSQTADVIAEPPGRPGLNAALDHARRGVRAASAGPVRLLVVHADLPLLTPDDVTAVLDAPADVVVATDRHGTGTNLLALPLLFPSCQDESRVDRRHVLTASGEQEYGFRFGTGSRAAHEAEASRLGLSSAVVHRPGTAADLDTVDDLADLPEATRDHLRRAVRL
jgi:2-phospho-L-lactate guanylyltransferase